MGSHSCSCINANMRPLTIAVLGIVVLCCVTSLGHAAAVPKPAFDWTQFLKAGVKRATIDEEGMPDTEEVDIDYQDSQFQIKPMTSFLSMKPTFMPPFVDPQFFIDKKTALLKGLFSPTGPVGGKVLGDPALAGPAIAPGFFAGKKTAFLSTLFNQLATTAPTSASSDNATKVEGNPSLVQRRLIAPWLTTPAPVVDPKVMADKKAVFLDKLFSSFNAAASEEGDGTESVTVKPTIVPPGFWVPFAPAPPVSFQPTVKPTIVPPDFWLPFPASKSATDAPKPSVPIVDPSVFIDKKTKFLNDLMNSLAAPPTLTNPGTGVPSQVSAPPPTIPVPTFDEKVSEFLDKLLEVLTTPMLADISAKRSTKDAGYSARSIPSPVAGTEPKPSTMDDTLLDPKDKVTSTIVGELTGIKNNMLDTLTDLLKSQKEAATAVTSPVTKPGKKIGPPFAGLWGPMAKLKPTPDPTIPFQQKIDVLNQVFDMLTSLQKDVTVAVNEAARPKTTVAPPTKSSTNVTILDLLKKKLMEMDDSSTSSPREVKPQVNMYGVPLKYNVRDVDTFGEALSRAPNTRNIKMALHQGYQSLPPGTTEMLQAGGGSEPRGKEGGGIKMQIIVPA